MSITASAEKGILYEDNFNYNYLDENWRTETSSNCYVAIGENNGLTGNSLTLSDNNDNTSSPHYEGYAKAFRTFTPQYDAMTVEFYFNSNKNQQYVLPLLLSCHTLSYSIQIAKDGLFDHLLRIR